MSVLNTIKNFDFSSILKRFDSRILFGLAAFGALYLGKHLYSALAGFTKYFLLPRKNLKLRYSGGWVVVTGASDGIGKAYCEAFAKEGFNIVLIARNEDKLNAVAKEIRSAYKVQTQVLVYDFGKLATLEEVSNLNEVLSKIRGDVSILVNNVGTLKRKEYEQQQVSDLM